MKSFLRSMSPEEVQTKPLGTHAGTRWVWSKSLSEANLSSSSLLMQHIRMHWSNVLMLLIRLQDLSSPS